MYKKVVLVASAMLTVERPPAAVAILAGICEHNNIEYEILDFNTFLRRHLGVARWMELDSMFATLEHIEHEDSNIIDEVNQVTDMAVDRILSYGPDLVAISVFSTMQAQWTEKLLERLKLRSKVTTIAGGPGISYERRPNKSVGKLLGERGLLDYWVLGEGDISFDQFLRGNIVLGVNSKDSKFENWVPQIDDLSNLILPSYKKYEFRNYTPVLAGNKAIITITGSRGCVRRCTFCDVGHVWKKYRFRTADSIVNEIIKHYKEVGVLTYFFSDSLINGSLSQFTEVMTKIVAMQEINSEFKKFSYSGQFIIRPEKHHPESMYKLMQQSGCDHIEVGIESGSERVREHMGKKFSNSDIDYHLRMCEKYGIKNHILMFTAYPTETLEDQQETIDFYIRNQKYIINDTIIGTNLNSPMIIFKNTPIDNMRETLGIEIHNAEYANMSNWTVGANPDLTVKERWRRYIELVQLTTNLRYTRATIDLTLIDLNIADLTKATHNMKGNEQ